MEGGRKEGFNEKRGTKLLKTCDRAIQAVGATCLVDVAATKGEQFKEYVDFVADLTEMPFRTYSWGMNPELERARY